MHTPKLRPIDKWLLAFIFLTFSASSIAWTLTDKTPPAWDPADHIIAGYDYYFPVANLDFAAFKEEFFVAPHYYAPFVHLITSVVFLVFGASRVAGIAVNLLSLAALLLSVSWIGRTLYGNGAEAKHAPLSLSVLAPLLATGYHFSAWLLHDAFLDYPLMAMVAVSFAMLLRADNFQHRRNALLFGLSAGLGMLTKQTYMFFMVLPALYVTIRVLVARDRKAILNLAMAGLVAVAVAAVWYGPHLDDVIEIYRVNKQAALNENEAPLFTFGSNLYYPHALLSTQMQLPFGLLFLGGLIYTFARRRRESVLLHLWLLGGIGAFILVANKDPRYTVPVLPAAALISVSWFAGSSLNRNNERRRSMSRVVAALKPAVVGGAAVWAFVSFFDAQWPRPGMGYYIDTPDFRWMVYARNYFTLDHHPGPDEWGVPDIVRTVVDDYQSRGMTVPVSSLNEATPTVGVVVNLPYLNPSSIALYARLLTVGRGAPPLFKVDWVAVESAQDRIPHCDFIVVRTGLDRAAWVAPMERYVEEMIKANPDRFTRIRSFAIPIEGAEAVLYRNGG